MAQKYPPGIAHERMAAGTCPECGNAPEAHSSDTNTAFLRGISGGCNLHPMGVEDRIEQYEIDRDEAAKPAPCTHKCPCTSDQECPHDCPCEDPA